jgi:DNA-binding CsgD family transcriptional regulator
LAAADELAQGSLEEEKQYLALAALGSVSVPTAGTAYLYFGAVLVSQGGSRRQSPGSSVPSAVRPEAEPAVAVAVYYVRGLLELARGRDADALTAYQAAERLAGHVAATHYLIPPARARLLQALERTLDIAEPDGALLTFLLHPAPGLLERHARQRTAHPSLIAEILSLLAGKTPAPPTAAAQPPREPLSETEIRVLRYLPTNLPAPEIANELHVSPNTVKTHVRHLHAKLGTHRRREAVAAPSACSHPPDGADPSPARHSPTSCGPTAADSESRQ